MKIETNNLLRKQLDSQFLEQGKLRQKMPLEGWIRTLRKSLGITQTQLAQKLNITKQSMASIENSEREGTITLSTLRKVAEALNCDIQLGLVPRKSLEEIIKQRAWEKAKAIVNRTALHMNLEAQGTNTEFREKQIKELAEEFIRHPNKHLWEDF